MDLKKNLRIKFKRLRKERYYEVKESFFNPLLSFLKKNYKKKINLCLYCPINYELNVMKLANMLKDNSYYRFLLPKITKKELDFHEWKYLSPLKLNKMGLMEPLSNIRYRPDVIIAPLLAYDKNKNRLGYGLGFYDKYIKKNKKKYNMITIGAAFSFQYYKNLPTNFFDEKVDYMLTEKGLFK